MRAFIEAALDDIHRGEPEALYVIWAFPFLVTIVAIALSL